MNEQRRSSLRESIRESAVQVRKSVRESTLQAWADLKSGTDASILSIARFIGVLYGPIDRSLPIDKAWRKAMQYRLPGHIGWGHALGGITYLLFIVLVVTGVLLSFYYRPSAQEAYPSIQHVVSSVSFGWLIRNVHHWSANLIIIALVAHMVRVFFAAAYKPPRETNWLVGVLLLVVVFGFGATGYLLPWDQWAYWTVTEALEGVDRLPLLGPSIVEIFRGDEVVSGATLSRFFAWHVIILPWAAFALLLFHFALVRRRGVAPPVDQESHRRSDFPFYPNHLLRSFMVVVLVIAVIISLAALFPRDVAEAANPYQPPEEVIPTWVVVDVSAGIVRYLGPWGLLGFLALGLTVLLLPMFDRSPERRIRHRPVAMVVGVLFTVVFVVAGVLGHRSRTVGSERTGPAAPVEGAVQEEPLRTLPELGPTPPRPARTEDEEGGGT